MLMSSCCNINWKKAIALSATGCYVSTALQRFSGQACGCRHRAADIGASTPNLLASRRRPAPRHQPSTCSPPARSLGGPRGASPHRCPSDSFHCDGRGAPCHNRQRRHPAARRCTASNRLQVCVVQGMVPCGCRGAPGPDQTPPGGLCRVAAALRGTQCGPFWLGWAHGYRRISSVSTERPPHASSRFSAQLHRRGLHGGTRAGSGGAWPGLGHGSLAPPQRHQTLQPSLSTVRHYQAAKGITLTRMLSKTMQASTCAHAPAGDADGPPAGAVARQQGRVARPERRLPPPPGGAQ